MQRVFKYTDKSVEPIPKYKKGDEVYFLYDFIGFDKKPTKCIIKSDADITWKEYDGGFWDVNYRFKPWFNERVVQYSIREEDLYPTEEEALIASFDIFKNRVADTLNNYREMANSLGINEQFLIENKYGIFGS